MKSALPYLGGKSRLASQVIKEIPTDHICYVEPFCGACWVLFAKEPSKAEIINDADSELTTFWRVIQNHLEEFQRYYKFAVTSREIFELEKRKDPSLLTDIQRAVRYFYLQKLGFGGKTSGRTFGTSATQPGRLNLLNIEEHLLELHWRLSPPRVTIEHLDALDCIRRYDRPSTFFYIDPPYYDTAGYAVPYGPENYLELVKLLSSIKGRFLLSLNDHPKVREIFAAFQIRTVKLKYSAGNSRTAAKTRSTERAEVLIRNY
jgi:DNA adenine methylase